MRSPTRSKKRRRSSSFPRVSRGRRPGSAGARPARLESGRVTDQPSRAAELLGRTRELRALDSLLDAAGGGAASVHGPAGIGKSAMLAALRERAAARGRVVLATAGVQ